MGGLIANNTSGHVIDPSIGKPGDYVLGLEVVLPNGDLIETGTQGGTGVASRKPSAKLLLLKGLLRTETKEDRRECKRYGFSDSVTYRDVLSAGGGFHRDGQGHVAGRVFWD
jgi:glycolate oxidase